MNTDKTMERNIFKNAKFGDKFLTRDGRVAIYINRDAMRFYYLGIEPCAVSGTQIVTFRYVESGKVDTGYRDAFDIISRYQEPLDEDKLDELATDYTNNIGQGNWQELEAYKSGYRKAKEV